MNYRNGVIALKFRTKWPYSVWGSVRLKTVTGELKNINMERKKIGNDLMINRLKNDSRRFTIINVNTYGR